MEHNLDYIIDIIRENLSNDLLKKEYLVNNNSHNKFSGHCYVASETLYHLMDDYDRKNYTPNYIKINNITHWFLKHKSGNIIDITKDQFDFKINYSKSKGIGFLTKLPSKRCKILIDKIYEEINC